MKHYLATIREQHGEFQCKIHILFRTDDPERELERQAEEWYGLQEFHTDEDRAQGYFWNGGMTYQAGTFYEIPEDVFNVLKNQCDMSDLTDFHHKPIGGS